MASSALGPRVLLRRLREVMAEPETAQKRLDKIVMLIAANMVAEVCSIYVMRPGQVLELFATEGLKREAVHKSQTEGRRGSGRHDRGDGEAAQSRRCASASGIQIPAGNRRRNLPLLPRRADPARRHRHRRAGRAKPHAAALYRGRRRGAADDGHGAGRGHRVGRAAGSRHERSPPTSRMSGSHHLKGEVLAEGIALGHAVLHEPRIVITNLIAENIPKEKARLEAAVAGTARPCRRDRRGDRYARRRIFRGARNLPHVRA